jgi:hypothetical protein
MSFRDTQADASLTYTDEILSQGHTLNPTRSRTHSLDERSEVLPPPPPLPLSFFARPPPPIPAPPPPLPPSFFSLIPPPTPISLSDTVPAKAVSLEAINPDLIALFPKIIGAPAGRSLRRDSRRLLPHPNRPAVQAHERMFFWVAESSLSIRRNLVAKTTPSSLSHYDTSLRAIWSHDTKVGYGAAILDWILWCDDEHVPEHLRLPADEQTFRLFITSKIAKEGKSKIAGTFSGIRAWHIAQELAWVLGNDPLTIGFKKAVISKAPASTSLPPRPPIRLVHLEALHRLLDLHLPSDSAFFAIACCAFWGVCRLGELVVPSELSDPEPDHRVRRLCNLTFSFDNSDTSAEPSGAVWHIPWTKTTGVAGADIVISNHRNSPTTSPTRALQRHMLMSSSLPPDAPLFAYADTGSPKGWRPSTRRSFMTRCEAIWKAENLGICSGHSFRIGGTTELLKRGLSHEWVKIQGRWKSDAFERYIRDTPEILRLELARLATTTNV